MAEENKFPVAPNWDKVERFTMILLNILNNNKLTYTEKHNILAMVESAVNRDFNMLGVITFLDSVAMHHEIAERQKLSGLYS